MHVRSHTPASRHIVEICRHPLCQTGLATDLILGILSASYSLFLPHVLTPPKHINCACTMGAKAVGSCKTVKETLVMPMRVTDMPSHGLISVTAKAHRWWQNQPMCLTAKRHQPQSCEAKDLAIMFNLSTCQRKRPAVLHANSSQ